jgi:hypothetical protein
MATKKHKKHKAFFYREIMESMEIIFFKTFMISMFSL